MSSAFISSAEFDGLFKLAESTLSVSQLTYRAVQIAASSAAGIAKIANKDLIITKLTFDNVNISAVKQASGVCESVVGSVSVSKFVADLMIESAEG